MNYSRICEHESVEWIIKKIPKFSTNRFFQNVPTVITCFDVNMIFFVLGTNSGSLYLINRKTNNLESLILKKGTALSQIKLIQTISLSVASGMENGLLYILKIPIKEQVIFSKALEFNVQAHNNSAITCMTWSKNSEKLFSSDKMGNVFCSEVDSAEKSVSSYYVCTTNSQVVQMSYDHKCLVVSTENESFIYSFTTEGQIPIGSKPRKQSGRFGACFLDKLCKPADVEIVVVRPDSKLWISDLGGIIKRTLLLNSESLFSSEKAIRLLPSVTSQSTSVFMKGFKDKALKYQLGLVSFISESDVLLYSSHGIILFDVSTGTVLASTANLGTVISISICFNNKVIESESLYNDDNTFDKVLLEIWILRKPLNDEESRLIRLSNIPLATSKLIIDPFYFYSNPQDSKYPHKPFTSEPLEVESSATKKASDSDKDTPHPVIKHKLSDNFQNLLPKFELNVTDKLEGMRNNVLEFTKKTKEVLKQEIFYQSDEEVEEALELTEEGLILKFENKIDDETVSLKKDDPISDSILKVPAEIPAINDIKPPRKTNRVLQIVDLDKGYIEDVLKSPAIVNDYSIERQTADTVIENANQVLSKDDGWLFNPELISTDLVQICKERYFSSNEDLASLVEEKDHLNLSDEIKISASGSTNGRIDDLYMVNEAVANTTLGPDEEESLSDPDVVEEQEESADKISEPSYQENPLQNRSIISSFPVAINSNLAPPFEKSYSSSFDEHFETKSNELISIFENSDDSQGSNILKPKEILTDEILTCCNKWVSHRGPILPGNTKISSLSINRRMIWIIDTKGSIHVGFKNTGEQLGNAREISDNHRHLQWLQDGGLPTEKIYSSPEGVIVWRDKSGDISVYTGVTRIWTPKVVKEKVLVKSNWEQTMFGIKDVDIDNEMAVIVTKRGQLKVMDGISARISYKQSVTASIAGQVTLASTFNGIIWCVTEITEPDAKLPSQHIFSCMARDDDGKLNISYWKTVPIPADLVMENEEHLGILGGSSAIKNIQLGEKGFAWIVTFHNLCFFSNNISSDNPTGDGIWYQISLHFLSHVTTSNDEYAGFGLDKLSSGIQTRVEKFFGYPESETRSKKAQTNSLLSSVLLSTKGIPKMSLGNGLLWVTSVDRTSPCILFESNKNILGHSWVNSFSSERKRKTITSLPAILKWSHVTFGCKNMVWLVNKSNEIFCFWNETRIRNIALPSSFGQVTKIACHNTSVIVLTTTSRIFFRINVTYDNPIGTEWRETINNTWNKESVKHISCFDNEIWIVTAENVYYNEDLRSTTSVLNQRKSPWKLFRYKLSEPFALIQEAAHVQDKKYIWALSDPDGYLYLGILNTKNETFEWIYIPGPRAKSVYVSTENLWMVDQLNGEVYVRCGIDWHSKPTGDYWIHIPVSTSPILCLAVSADNNVVVIDNRERLLTHNWSVITSPERDPEGSPILSVSRRTNDGDWELLN